MTLSIALGTALSGLSAASEQTSTVSRNVARVNDADASRKIANLESIVGGGVRVASITRATDEALFDKMLGATSSAAQRKAVADALAQLDQTVNDPELEASPAALVTKLTNALQQYASAPQDAVRARAVIAAADGLAASLRSATGVVQGVRAQADLDMAQSVDRVNSLLAKFSTVNAQIIQGTRAGDDITDQLDERDQILAGLSEELGIRTVTRTDNDMAIFTDGGITLFDRSARLVSFDRTMSFDATTAGNEVRVDGVPITGSSGPMLSRSGRLSGLADIRDNLAVTYQSQLDEIARGLIQAFAESDQSATPSLPDAPGLFTYAGAPAMPPAGTVLAGLAATIATNPNVDPAQGGDANRLRDGGISDPGNPAYVYNTTGTAGYSDRLLGLLDKLDATLAFDPAAQGDSQATVAGFASTSVAWLQQARKTAADSADYQNTLLQRSSAALNAVTGINLDDEMATMLELERSYQASSKLISAIDEMLQTLLSVTG
jgi:flagellar hook-associated protein 1 FlgK